MPGNYNFHSYQPLIYLTNLFIIIILIDWDNNNSWGYHGDDGMFCGKIYGPLFTTGDTIGCCLDFINNMVFYTKNGINLGNYYFNTVYLK